MPVEAMAAGTPVVVGPVGGARESVIDGLTGAVAESVDPIELARAIDRCAMVQAADCARRAADFATTTFVERLRTWVDVEK